MRSQGRAAAQRTLDGRGRPTLRHAVEGEFLPSTACKLGAGVGWGRSVCRRSAAASDAGARLIDLAGILRLWRASWLGRRAGARDIKLVPRTRRARSGRPTKRSDWPDFAECGFMLQCRRHSPLKGCAVGWLGCVGPYCCRRSRSGLGFKGHPFGTYEDRTRRVLYSYLSCLCQGASRTRTAALWLHAVAYGCSAVAWGCKSVAWGVVTKYIGIAGLRYLIY